MRRAVLAAVLLVGALLAGAASPSAQPVTVRITAPRALAVVNGDWIVTASVQSTYDLREIRAAVGGLSVLMGRDGPAFSATIPAASLPSATYLITVTATDVFGASASAQVSVILDRRPVLTVAQPVSSTVTRGPVPVSATCVDAEGACTITVTAAGQTLTGPGAVSGTFDLSSRDGSPVGVGFDAVDGRGQHVSATHLVYIESDARWTERQAAPGVIEDATADRLLVGLDGVSYNEWPRAAIIDRRSGAEVEVPIPSGRSLLGSLNYRFSYLTPGGVIFVSELAGGNVLSARVLEWNAGILTDLGTPNSPTSLKVSGRFATWMNGDTLFLRDTGAETTTVIATNAVGNNGYRVASDGRVLYGIGRTNTRSYLYQNGVSALFADGSAFGEAVYEGDSTYYYDTVSRPNRSLWLFDGSTHRRLVERVEYVPISVAGGWLTFGRPGNLDQNHVWLRSPAGAEQQVSFFAAASTVEAVSPTGEVIFTSNRRRYWASPSRAAVDVGPDWGRVQWLDGEWTRALGRSLFTLAPNGGVASDAGPEAARPVRVTAAYPNPVRSGFTLAYDLPRALAVRIWVVDALGRRVAELEGGVRPAGASRTRWQTDGLPSGAYTVLLETAEGRISTPVTVVR